jgi:hypothetical protein
MGMRRHRQWIAVLAACGLVFVACGSSAPKDASGRQAGGQPTAGADADAAVAVPADGQAEAPAVPAAGTDSPAPAGAAPPGRPGAGGTALRAPR